MQTKKINYNGQGITFDGNGMCSFGNDFVENVVVFDVDNTSSSHTDNKKNNFLLSGERQTKGINNSVGAAGKKVVLALVKFNFS